MALGVDSASNRNEYHEYFLGGKGGQCIGLTTLPPSCADCLEIWQFQPLGTLRACPGLEWECFTFFSFLWCCDPTRVMTSSFFRFLDHTKRRTTVGRTPLNQWSARRRDLYLTTHNTHNRQTSMPPMGFEPTISAGERPQTYALDRAATGIGHGIALPFINKPQWSLQKYNTGCHKNPLTPSL